MAAGSTIRELRVIGASGGTSTSFGLLETAPGENHLIAHTVAAPAIATISAAIAILLHGKCIASHPRLGFGLTYLSGEADASMTTARRRRIAFRLMVAEHRSGRFDASSPNAS
jgi:hypothetical protein